VDLSTNAIVKKGTVLFAIAYPILFVQIVITVMKKFGYVQTIANNIQ
jgi:hypothetical protein